MHHLVYRNTIFLLIALFAAFKADGAITDYSVTHYTNENGLPQNSVRGIELDKEGFLWIATEAGLVRFDGQHFKVYDRNHYPVMRSNRIFAIWLNHAGRICFRVAFDRTSGDYTFDEHGQILRYPYQPYSGKTAQFKNNRFRIWQDTVFYEAKGRTLWKTGVTGLRHQGLHYWGQMNGKCYYRNDQGEIWSIDSVRNKVQVHIKGLPLCRKSNVTRTGSTYNVYKQNDTLYIGVDKGIYQICERSKGELEALLVLKTDIDDIHIYRYYPQLNLHLIGTFTHGLYLIRSKQFTTCKHLNGFGNYYPQVPFGDSGVLTDRGIVYPTSSRFDYPFKNPITYRGLLLDRAGNYWVNRTLLDSFQIVKLDSKLHVVKSLPSAYTAYCFRETLDGRIWMTSFQGKHLGYINKDSLLWLPRLWGEKLVQTFLPQDNETFWLGGVNILAKLNLKTGQLLHYKSLENFTIETLYLDKDKVLWIGTTGNGFFALKQDSIYKLPLDKNAGLKDVHTFMEDKSGFIWMSTNNGLFRCKKNDLDQFIAGKTREVYYQCFKKESGFNTNEFNGSCTPSGIILGNGKFSLPSLDGLVQYYPDSIHQALPESKIFIDKFLVDGQEQDIGRDLSLPPSFQHIEIEVVSPFFGLADNQKLEYNVKGLDHNWYPVNNENKIELNRFPYGNYTLHFRKRAGFGPDNFVTLSLNFHVNPFFYQTWYFRLGLIMITGLLVFLFIRARYAYLIKRNKVLEGVITQRTAHLDNANRLKEKILMMVGHDLQSPLHFLSHLSKINVEAVALKQHDKVGQVSQHIDSATKKITTFVEEFSLWARVQDEAFNLRKTEFPMSTLIADLQDFSRDILHFSGNTLECSVADNYLLYTNMELLKAVLRNLIDNANKHTKNGLIRINCIGSGDSCQITVTDNGAGISEDRLKKINELLFKARHATLAEPANGRLGYQFIADFAHRLQADISINSEKDRGTTVCVSGIAIAKFTRKAEKQLT
jgi:signal transduction histidine kinase